MSKFLTIFSWEAKRILRFPLLEIYLVLVMLTVVTEMSYVSYTISSGSAPIVSTLSDRLVSLWEAKTFDIVRLCTPNLFIMFILTGSTLVGNFMAKEIENGTTKLLISHPISRSQVFLSKYLVLFFTLAIVPSIVILLAIFMLDPRFPIQLLHTKTEILALVALMFMISFYVTSVSVACSILSKNVALAMLGAIGILLVLNIISNNYTFLPGRSLYNIYSILIGGDVYYSNIEKTVAMAFMPTVGLILTTISYYVFSRRMEFS